MLTKNLLLSAASVLLLGACGEQQYVTPEETAKSGSEAQVVTADPKVYPVGPYGFVLDTVIPNLSFVGKADMNASGKVNDDSPRRISLADYYGKKDLKLLVLLVAAEWCGPCNQEQGELVSSYKKLAPKGVDYLEAITQSTNGKPADLATIDRWTGKAWTDQQTGEGGLYLPFPVVADPTDLSELLGASAIPTQIIVRVSDMTIVDFHQGYGKGWLEREVNGQLAQLE